MGTMKTPGVYVIEKNAFPNSVVEVATAVPAFIGYTEKAAIGAKSLKNVPWRITSMSEFRSFFGGAPKPAFTLTGQESTARVKRTDSYSLYYNMLLFYANGGGPCYIVSAGDYTAEFSRTALEAGIAPLLKEQEPTMVLIPEAVSLPDPQSCYDLQQAVLRHCGSDMKNRFAVLDIYDGYKDRKDPDPINTFREKVGTEFLNFGAAYYPWLNTSVVQDNELNFNNLNTEELKPLLTDELKGMSIDEAKKTVIESYIDQLGAAGMDDVQTSTLHKVLLQVSPLYRQIMSDMRTVLNLMPASAAMAGIYTMTDNSKGVWKAPANVGVALAVCPAVNISHEDQEDLNVPISGKSVNAIRSFTGEGIKVWGARTLDGNSLDWRYINVCRTLIMLEGSIRNAARTYVFEPNVADTWVSVKNMISNFLTGIWKRGGLAGSTPRDAFSVHVGLGETMTPEDILEGVMRITVLVAVSRPAEFIEITFQQQMQKN